MRGSSFVYGSILIFCGLLGFHGLMGAYITRSNEKQLAAKVVDLNEQIQRSELKALLAQDQLQDYEQHVATLLPQNLPTVSRTSQQYQLRQLASLSRVGDSLEIGRGSSLFEDGKKYFRTKSYEKAAVTFGRLVEVFPHSPFVIDAMFLQAESQYQLGDFIEAITTIDKMVTLFPESEATGFALLRLGRIYEKQSRLEDAADIYRSVLVHYSNHDLRSQAHAMLKVVEL